MASALQHWMANVRSAQEVLQLSRYVLFREPENPVHARARPWRPMAHSDPSGVVSYHNHGPANISVVPRFTIHEDHYQDLLEDLADVAARWEAFEFEADGICGAKPHGCVTVQVRDDDGILQEIMGELPPLVWQTRNRFSPHVTSYKGSPKMTWFPSAWTSNHYEAECRNLRAWSVSGKVMGLQLLQGEETLESVPFGA
ncbi:hypothetical protein DFH08DRAFT_815878 [Mycena albidolilacea]|uniref:2'-5' RNA ligase family protein n=1 Tax=Mycena albidolilacea TaxID=1033008 RepID=A0AAD6ZLJ6_9AGAR|nr:hypothetical protein DFH08DRAFT_815878 [Mycena albidolilacea]